MAVLGLNPHCGEGGLLGEEEKREVLPAIAEAKSLGMDVEGPFPADSFFNLSGRTVFRCRHLHVSRSRPHPD